MDISKYNKAEVLAALYNNAKSVEINCPHRNMTKRNASDLLREKTYFECISGRMMKVDFSGDKLDTSSYNQYNGEGAAERIISQLKQKG